jgi:hypothetical protein
VVDASSDEADGKPKKASNKMDKSLRNDQIESRLQRIHKKVCRPGGQAFPGFEGRSRLFSDVYTGKRERNDCTRQDAFASRTSYN